MRNENDHTIIAQELMKWESIRAEKIWQNIGESLTRIEGEPMDRRNTAQKVK
jgi:hypothetical protein